MVAELDVIGVLLAGRPGAVEFGDGGGRGAATVAGVQPVVGVAPRRAWRHDGRGATTVAGVEPATVAGVEPATGVGVEPATGVGVELAMVAACISG